MKEVNLGRSVQGIEINGYSLGDENAFNKTLIIGGIHGSEPQSKEICDLYIKENKEKKSLEDSYLLIIPGLNPDGLKVKKRGNGNDVDLNRNFPSNTWRGIIKSENSSYFPGVKPASEPETKIVTSLLNKYNFKKIISIHTNHAVQHEHPAMINYNGDSSRELAVKLSHVTGLIAQGDIGYPTPGSLGTWVGMELKKISITVELDHKKTGPELYNKCRLLFDVSVAYV